MKIEINQTTLIDQVEDSLLTYFKKNDLRCGDSIPNENNLAAELGVARSVVREALSRLKMMGDSLMRCTAAVGPCPAQSCNAEGQADPKAAPVAPPECLLGVIF